MDGDDDYMGDLSRFLPPELSAKCGKSSHSTTQSELSTKSRGKLLKGKVSWQERRRLGKEKRRQEEDEETLAKMEECPIPQSNIGFKLLKQMGYDPELSRSAEPVGIQIRRTRVGIGREDPAREKRRREFAVQESEQQRSKEIATEFGDFQRSRWKGRRLIINYHKAKAALDQLENKDAVTDNKADEEEDDTDQEEEEAITDEDLLELLQKLRNEHRYCLFCGFQYESSEALVSGCPGIEEDEH